MVSRKVYINVLSFNTVIKAIIFDYGGVLSENVSLSSFGRAYASKFGKDPEEFRKVLIENWIEARVNTIESQQFWKTLAQFIGIDETALRKDFMNGFKFKEDVFTLAKKLKRKYKLGLLSNHIEDWLEELIQSHHLGKTFEVIVTSYKSKIAKPELEIFKEIVEKLHVKPSECVYIDDREKNIPPAKELGMKPILFTGIDQLKKELASYSVIVD
ncbi:HAD family phosphatase [Candidatus Woesearchaeota archaeon]|nr:MAG: HAD family phosphatase [Candidatus Woesearchaeota archaeon]